MPEECSIQLILWYDIVHYFTYAAYDVNNTKKSACDLFWYIYI